MDVQVGQIFRDTYYDRKQPGLTNRTIKVLEVLPNGVVAQVLTDTSGQPPKHKGRVTTIQFKTLRAGYERVSA